MANSNSLCLIIPMWVPRRSTANSQGILFVVDGTGRIQKFDQSGKFVGKFGSTGQRDGQFRSPASMAADARGNIYVVDSERIRIQKFSPNGTLLAAWGSRGSSDGKFMRPVGIAVDHKGDVYVGDDTTGRVQKFDERGRFLLKWGGQGDEDGKFYAPENAIGAIAVDNKGAIYVTDNGHSRVQKFTDKGKYLAKWGTQGVGPGQFNYPVGIAVDRKGNLYVADSLGGRLQKFESAAG